MVSFDIKKVCAFLSAELNDFNDKSTRWQCIMIYTCMYDHDFDMDFHLMVMLRSITGLYGRPVIEVAYGEMIFSLHRGCVGDDSSGRVVGVST